MKNKTKYQEFHFNFNDNTYIAYRGNLKNGNRITYNEYHSSKHTIFYIR